MKNPSVSFVCDAMKSLCRIHGDVLLGKDENAAMEKLRRALGDAEEAYESMPRVLYISCHACTNEGVLFGYPHRKGKCKACRGKRFVPVPQTQEAIAEYNASPKMEHRCEACGATWRTVLVGGHAKDKLFEPTGGGMHLLSASEGMRVLCNGCIAKAKEKSNAGK